MSTRAGQGITNARAVEMVMEQFSHREQVKSVGGSK
jgi:hypothetical protein